MSEMPIAVNHHSFIPNHKQFGVEDVFIRMKSLLERLAPEETFILYSGEDCLDASCIFCDGDALFLEDIHHAPDFPWVEARKLLEELK
jgi:hypothetical protein